MNYEQKYNEALKWVQKLYPSFEDWVKEDAEHYFPELTKDKNEKIKKVTIKSIKYIKTLVPEGSGGTGYSQPNYFDVELESGDKRKIIVDIWYTPVEMIRSNFISSLWRLGGEIDNLEQAYEMYVDEIITNRLCPYNKNELML